MKIISWNCGSASRKAADLLALLAVHRPHLLCVQEGRFTRGTTAALRAEARALGYSLHTSPGGDLGVLVLRGLNFVPLRAESGDEGYTLARYGVQLSATRLLVRHLHADPQSKQARSALFDYLSQDAHGDMVLDVGDFNETLSDRPNLNAVWPQTQTFRRAGHDAEWISTPDGAACSNLLVPLTSTVALDAVPDAQHKPIMVQLNTAVLLRDIFAWNKGQEGEARPWTDPQKQEFQHLFEAGHIDEAWAHWHSCSFGATPYIQTSARRGAWPTGDETDNLNRLFSKVRKLRARGCPKADAEADGLFEKIACAIDCKKTERLEAWREKVSTRSGASAWVKSRLAQRLPPVLDSFRSATLDAAAAARRAAESFAQRWNAGVYQFDRDNATTSSWMTAGIVSSPIVTPPAPRVCPEIDLSAFTDLPVYVAPGRWSPSDILAHSPDGAPGPDGATTSWLRSCHSDSLARLCLLLDAADAGQPPAFWQEARVCLIPKSPDAPPGDLRPITVMSVLYRTWARRHATSINEWMALWCPSGLMGAMPSRSAASASQRAAHAIDLARTRLGAEVYVLTLDQSKCFDRINLDALEAIVQKCNIQSLRVGLHIYRQLSRIMFLHGEPTAYVLKNPTANGLIGIPQGCPIATIYCNLLAVVWLHRMQAILPHATAFSYLDDRMILASSWSDLDAALQATIALDRSVGPELNAGKCACAHAPGAGRVRKKRPAGLLRGIKIKNVIKYLGVDLLVDGRVASPTSAQRERDFIDRVRLVSGLPSVQRDACLCDAVSALYLEGGSIYSKTQLSRMSNAAASALFGSAHQASKRLRARDAAHLVGIGCHRTCPAAAAIVSWVKQAWRHRAAGTISNELWTRIFEQRQRATAGLCKFVVGPLAAIDIQWVSRGCLRCGGDDEARRSFLFFDDTLTFPPADGEAYLKSPQCRRKLHELRDFLRFAVARKLALHRPRDFSGLEHGWHSCPDIRRSAYTAWHHPGGRSLLTGGVWTRSITHAIWSRQQPTLTCPRCHGADEDRAHRLWLCPANQPFLSVLSDKVKQWTGETAVVSWLQARLPPAALRCGLFPATYTGPKEVATAVVAYLSDVNHHANQSAVAERRGQTLPVARPGMFDAAAAASLGRREHAPLPRRSLAERRQQCTIARRESDPVDSLTLAVDGSFDADAALAGWGVIIMQPGVAGPSYLCAPLSLDRSHLHYTGASKFSNNTAELAAIARAADWLVSCAPRPASADLLFDSMWAANMARGIWNPTCNGDAVLYVRSSLERLRDAGITPRWHHVCAHQGHYLNELADEAAKRGAHGHVQLHAACVDFGPGSTAHRR